MKHRSKPTLGWGPAGRESVPFKFPSVTETILLSFVGALLYELLASRSYGVSAVIVTAIVLVAFVLVRGFTVGRELSFLPTIATLLTSPAAPVVGLIFVAGGLFLIQRGLTDPYSSLTSGAPGVVLFGLGLLTIYAYVFHVWTAHLPDRRHR